MGEMKRIKFKLFFKIPLMFLYFTIILYCLWTYPLFLNYSNYIYSNYFGDNVGWLTYSWQGFNGGILEVISLIFNYLFNSSIVAYNLLVFISFILTFLSFSWFSKKFKVPLFVSLLGSFLLSVAPLRIWQSFEWPGLSNWGFLVLYLYFLSIFVKKPNLKISLLSGLAFGFSFNMHPYYGVILFFVTLFLFIYFYIEYTLANNLNFFVFIKNWFFLGLFCVLFSLPTFYYLFIPQNLNGNSIVLIAANRSPHDRWAYSARPWHYLIPDINHPVFGDLAVKIHYKIWSSTPYYLTEPFFPKEHTLYLGYTLMFLSFIAVFAYLLKPLIHKNYSYLKTRESFYVRFFLIVGITAFIFSMPPFITFNGLKFYFPSYFVYSFLPQFRAYARFGALVIISNITLAMLGFGYLLSKIKDSKKIIFSVLVFALTIFEFINFPPFHNLDLSLPPAYKFLSKQKGDFSYLEIPVQKDYSDIFYATKHKKTPLNPYYRTPKDVPNANDLKGENILYSDIKICYLNKKYNLQYLFYHRPIEKPLKLRIAESWGFPAWGTHADIQKDVDAAKRDFVLLEQKLKNLRSLQFVGAFERILVFKVVNCNGI